MRTSFNIPDDLLKKLKIYAIEQGFKSMNDLVVVAIKEKLKKDGEK